MKVTISHSDVKRRRGTLYNVRCALQFNQEEIAIIRERSLSDNYLSFEGGQVNYPEGADGPLDPAWIQIGSRWLFLIGIPLMFFQPGLAILCWIAAAAGFFYRKSMERTLAKTGQDSITLAQIMRDGAFTVSAFGSPVQAQNVEGELRKNLEDLKSTLTTSAVIPKSQSFEM